MHTRQRLSSCCRVSLFNKLKHRYQVASCNNLMLAGRYKIYNRKEYIISLIYTIDNRGGNSSVCCIFRFRCRYNSEVRLCLSVVSYTAQFSISFIQDFSQYGAPMHQDRIGCSYLVSDCTCVALLCCIIRESLWLSFRVFCVTYAQL